MDGQLLLSSNVPDSSALQIVARYKSLADIERSFHVLKSEIEIAPVFHRLRERIRLHAGICFMALVLHRMMRQRLRLAGSTCRPRPRCGNCARCSTIGCASTAPSPSPASPPSTRTRPPPWVHWR